jgi:D-alanyl-D-alanine carboxypeptidase
VERDGARLVAVVLGGKTAAARDAYMRQILNTTYARLADPEAVQVADAAATPSRQPAVARVASAAAPTGGAGGSGAWAVQVGAFRSYTAAERQAQSVAGLVAPRSTPVQVAVVAAENNPKPLYRARLVGFDSAHEARRVCSQLKQKKIGCLPVSL